MPRMPQPPGGGPRGPSGSAANSGSAGADRPAVKLPGLPQSMAPGEAVAKVLGSERDLEAPVTVVIRAAEHFVFTTGDGNVVWSGIEVANAAFAPVHDGAILSAAACGDRVLTGGDDGLVALTTRDGEREIVWRSAQRRWIDQVASAPDGVIAWTSAKVAYVRQGSLVAELELPAAAGGLAFAPKTNRLAVSHYGGVTVWDLDGDTTQAFEWKGAHLEVHWSPDEKYLITAMQEGAIHGWRVSDGSDFAMRGYPGKPRSLSFSRKGDWLATSGAFECVLWPFVGKGPMGKSPDQLARRTHMVTAVACHPLNLYVATGYEDGAVLLARQEDRRELVVRKPGNGAVTGLAWAHDGKQLAYGTDGGHAGVVDFSKVQG